MMLSPINKGWERHGRSTFGILMVDEYTGKGYGTEALTWLVHEAFYRHNLRRIDGETIGANARALAAYLKVGFKVEGRKKDAFFFEGGWTDEIFM